MRRRGLGKTLAAAVLVVLLLVMMRVSGLEREERGALEAGLRDGGGVIQGAIMQVGYQLRDGLQHLFSLSENSEVAELRRRVRELEGEIGTLREYQLENARLRQLLDYRENNPETELLVANVIARDPGNWFGVVKVNRGARHGVRRDQAVVLPAGLVGRVIAVTPATADVLLITDSRSRVGAMLQETRIPGVVRGVLNRSRPLQMSYLTREAAVEAGKLVVTSGLGVFPKGIPVGRVVEVQKDAVGLTLTADLEPLVDLVHLEEVLIVLGPPPEE